MHDRNEVCDYIIHRVLDAEAGLNHLKLQKLLYYVQAWYLAFTKQTLFVGGFQAWVHGPVNRDIYNRFSVTKSLYSEIDVTDCTLGFVPETLSEDARLHVDSVLDVYAGFTGDQLEQLTHQELPWTEARKGCQPYERCERLISEKTMAEYYGARVEGT